MSDDSGENGRPDAEEAILEAAHEVFVRRGTAGARMREIAEAAGVNQALLHYYFRSKEGLARAVFQQAARRLMPAVLGVLVSDSPLEEKVRRVIQIEMDVLARHPYLPGYILCELAHNPERTPQLVEAALGERRERPGAVALEVLGRQLEERAADGSMRPMAPEQFVVNLLALAIFPFAARPLLQVVMGLDEDGYGSFLKARRRELSGFFLRGMRP